MTLVPLTESGTQIIHGYGDGGFRVGETRLEGSLIITPEAVYAWPVSDFDALEKDDFALLHELEPAPDILLLGCGPAIKFLPPGLRAAIKAAGPMVDVMDTGAACRTYNILLAEDRRVAAAVIAV